ncbi:DUF6153 family protein [Streptomyces sp. NBC_01637]|uniref:DUF6153 family protein n=1 Tax=unclassified Streptomyces TaxID=2593676 RepID=UPI0038706DE5|nr:DUF6153 family protein [Streptomyces sp. NBC_01653]WTD93468.1 DUF6153 family protein [Streptomyces sp. NBC_01637]
MKASRYVRAGGALGHLLLVVVLALGIFAMHSMGHPSESAHSTMTTTSGLAATDTAAADHAPMSAPADMITGPHATDTGGSSSTHEPAVAMDMLSLCVAVLFGASVLTALLRSAFARHQEWRLAKLLAQVAAVSRPNPPPRGPDLTRLSVLRL